MCRSLLVVGTDVYPMVSQSTSGQAFDEVIAELIKQHIFPPLLSALFQISIKLLLSYVLNPFVYCTLDAPFEFSNYWCSAGKKRNRRKRQWINSEEQKLRAVKLIMICNMAEIDTNSIEEIGASVPAILFMAVSSHCCYYGEVLPLKHNACRMLLNAA